MNSAGGSVSSFRRLYLPATKHSSIRFRQQIYVHVRIDNIDNILTL